MRACSWRGSAGAAEKTLSFYSDPLSPAAQVALVADSERETLKEEGTQREKEEEDREEC